MPAVVKTENLVKDYKLGLVVVNALRGVSFEIQKGELLALVGPSGCGKSTLMHLLGCLDRPTSGKVLLDGEDISTMNDNQLAEIRGKRVGFVFQTFNLLPRLSAAENVELPLAYTGVPVKERRPRVEELLKKVGLADRMDHKPPELSGGQRQRVAIARALINNPAIVFADEPTGNLDSKSGEEIIALFKQLNNNEGVTIVMVTHDANIAAQTRRNIQLKDGQIISDENR
ncbi:macrolide ABC transporter ATP-binding protein [Candidatus Saganbacteria bacterium CG08_land_8_20_14_0_20_45_16]|uniref:Macrolide ABC transporter ATP-binding protein n=1 Tax=Candidatus Saganbacteria bacterium CG08_land_8_20_14_0_20_45_16 TaxID=2014293 RepID=A0A2H0XUH4_UNCSA|nr:MAG: macrolide ABC transporter ATP-binding protein [Candidatus Saganbacteria bacterium CG08_land_8_20_14_0_20_45_16]